MDIEVKVKDKILKPVTEIFEAIVNPDKLSNFFITRASGPIKVGDPLTWFFDDIGGQLPVTGKSVNENHHIAFEWLPAE
jgi:uncharacterized protein YndB with AHSA1/START domain